MVVLAKQARRRRQRRMTIRVVALLLVVVVGLFSYFTNPFVKFSVVIDPYTEISYHDAAFDLTSNSALIVQDDAFFRSLAQVKSFWHIFSSYFAGGQKAKRTSVDQIIREIHELRFQPDQPFLISGDHFSVFYPRSLGIFYHSILDPRTALDETDWNHRQHLYLKSTAYALQVYAQSDRLSTTIVPVGPRSVALMNIYAPPSDTLYSLLYALKVMQDSSELTERYRFVPLPDAQVTEAAVMSLQTASAAAQLTRDHLPDLQRHYQQYLSDVVDPATGLVRTDMYLSSTKDIVKRHSSFYDNIVLWRTKQLAMELGIIDPNLAELAALKQKILTQFWLEPEGYFLEQLEPTAMQRKDYSSDWIFAYMSGFLNPQIPEERRLLTRSVSYIQRNALDQPFGLQYSADRRDDQLYGIVRYTAPAYGSTTIWSNWGMEYIKLLADLAFETADPVYLEQADRQLAAYTFNIKRYRGYPEVYDANGDFFRTPFYKSIRRTGWVVSYEQARDMVEWVRVELGGE